MQCFICVTYMFFITIARPGVHPGAYPSPLPGTQTPQSQRSLFHDVIESLRIRSQLPDDTNENNLSQNYDRYDYEEEQELPSDTDFIPRRNDRIERPTLRYRYPKTLNATEEPDAAKEEIVVFIDTSVEPKTTTQKPIKKQKRPRPPVKKPVKKDDEEEILPEFPTTNNMSGQSQIGNRETQLVVKPTVIVNLRGSVTHRDSDIRIEGRKNNDTQPQKTRSSDMPHNIFNINQRIQLERTFGATGSNRLKNVDIKVTKEENDSNKNETDIDVRKDRKIENTLEVWFDLPNVDTKDGNDYDHKK